MASKAPEKTWPAEPTSDPGNKPNAAKPLPEHANPDAVDHAMIKEGGSKSQEGGKDEGLVNPPTVSMYPTSEPQGDAKAEIGEHRIIDNASLKLNSYIPEATHIEFNYPFEALELNQGMFIPVEDHSTIDKLMAKVFKQVDQYRKQNSEVERDEDGDDVMEDVCINKKLRNEDGTVKLDGDTPRMTVKSGFRPKLIGPNFAVKAVVKGDNIGEDDEADADGALVIRLG